MSDSERPEKFIPPRGSEAYQKMYMQFIRDQAKLERGIDPSVPDETPLIITDLTILSTSEFHKITGDLREPVVDGNTKLVEEARVKPPWVHILTKYDFPSGEKRNKHWNALFGAWYKWKNKKNDGVKDQEPPVSASLDDFGINTYERLFSFREWYQEEDKDNPAFFDSDTYQKLDPEGQRGLAIRSGQIKIADILAEFNIPMELTPNQLVERELQLIQSEQLTYLEFFGVMLTSNEKYRVIGRRNAFKNNVPWFTDFPDGIPDDPNLQPYTQNYPGTHKNTDTSVSPTAVTEVRDKQFGVIISEQVDQILDQAITTTDPLGFFRAEERKEIEQLKRGGRKSSYGGDYSWNTTEILLSFLPSEPKATTALNSANGSSDQIEEFTPGQNSSLERLRAAIEKGVRDDGESSVRIYYLLEPNHFSRAAMQDILNVLGLAERPNDLQFEAVVEELEQSNTDVEDERLRITTQELRDLETSLSGNDPTNPDAFSSDWSEEAKGKAPTEPNEDQIKHYLSLRWMVRFNSNTPGSGMHDFRDDLLITDTEIQDLVRD